MYYYHYMYTHVYIYMGRKVLETNGNRRVHLKRLLQAARESFIHNLLVRNNRIILMTGWTSLAPWECGFPFSGSLISTFLVRAATFRER